MLSPIHGLADLYTYVHVAFAFQKVYRFMIKEIKPGAESSRMNAR